MEKFGKLYSEYYSLMYANKDYKKECEYVNDLIKSINPYAKQVLDLGCGTGNYTRLLNDSGYDVKGIDLSAEMLEIARQKNTDGCQIQYHHMDIRDFKLADRFDVVTALFHVMSYLQNKDDIVAALSNIKAHLKPNGLFVFDFWYAPAVLNDLPSVRIKRVNDGLINVTRISEPTLDVENNRVNVNFDIFIEDMNTQSIAKKTEKHIMRYYFDSELESMCQQAGFCILKKYEWMTHNNPSVKSWYAIWVIQV